MVLAACNPEEWNPDSPSLMSRNQGTKKPRREVPTRLVIHQMVWRLEIDGEAWTFQSVHVRFTPIATTIISWLLSWLLS
jgi:hypothetical protein